MYCFEKDVYSQLDSRLDKLENKLTTTEISVKYELAPSTISTIFSNRYKITLIVGKKETIYDLKQLLAKEDLSIQK